jgi:hypothetical protein
MIEGHWWFDIDFDWGKQIYSDINLSHCPCTHHKYSVGCVRIKPQSSQREGTCGDVFSLRTALKAGKSRDGVFGIFYCHNPPDRSMALGLTYPLTNKYQEYLVVVKAVGVYG